MFAFCGTAPSFIPEKLHRFAALRMTSTKCAPVLNAVQPSPTLLTSKLQMSSSASTCRKFYCRKRRLNRFPPGALDLSGSTTGVRLFVREWINMPIGLLTLEIYIHEAH